MDVSHRASLMKRGRGLREEYSTTGARKQEAQCFRGSFTCRFLGEWTYMLGLAAGRCRGADAPSPHAGVYEKGKRKEGRGLVPGKTKSEEVEAGARTLEGVDTVCTANSSTTIIHSHQLLPSNWKSSYSFTCCRKNGIRDCRKSRSQSSICTGGFEFTINNGYVYFGSVL